MSEQPIDKPVDRPAVEASLAAMSTTASAGSLLREARAKSGLSLEDVSAQTKIAVPALQALERDDFSRLGQPVYVRGYLRKFAKALNLPENSVVAAFDARESPREPGAQQMRLAREAVEVRPRSKSAIWILLVVGAAAGGGYFLWQSRQAPAPAVAEVPAVSAPEPTTPAMTQEPAAASASDLPSAAPTAEAAPVAEAVGAAAGMTPNPLESTTAAAPPPAPESQPAASPSAPQTATALPVPETTAAGGSVQPSEPHKERAANEAVSNDAAVTLTFRDSSWVRIRDSRNKVLLNGLVQGGKTESMTGVPPYTISLGRAAAVSSVKFQGRTVDLAPYTASGGMAYFTLPPSPATTP
jgi:cytoskeleton protein RodZ